MGEFKERLRQLNQEAQDREQGERRLAAASAAEARANERETAMNRGLVTRITAGLRTTAAEVRSSFAGGPVPQWHENLSDDGGGFFIIPDSTGPLGEVKVSLVPLPASVKCTVAAHRNATAAVFSRSRDFKTPASEADVTAWVESMLPEAFAVFYGARS